MVATPFPVAVVPQQGVALVVVVVEVGGNSGGLRMRSRKTTALLK